MLHDSYQILGLEPGADAKAIRTAFVREAKACHPDAPDGDTERFRAVNQAYETLRAVDPTAEAQRHKRRRAFFDRLSRRGSPQPAELTLRITLSDLCKGVARRLTLHDDRQVEVQIPPGHDPARKLRIAREGETEIFVKLTLHDDEAFERQDRDLVGQLTCPLCQMRQGAMVDVRTPSGRYKVDVPPLSSPGKVLRLQGKGLPASGDKPAGNLLLTLHAERAEAFTRMVDHFARRFADKPKRLAAHKARA